MTGPYSESYTYNQIGNMTARNGNAYTYGAKPHAVTAVSGGASYSYDNNGNMTARGAQTITWDVENRPVSITGGASFIYDGDGNRAKKTENGETILYINKYYEKNLTTSVVTVNYFLGEKLVAIKTGDTLRYVHQDHLTGTSLMSTSGGALDSSITYLPYGTTRGGSINTDKKFTGQRLDGTGLYYYGARYYDPVIGRFISADPLVKNYANPQNFNRYAYVLNNPLKHTDPFGLFEEEELNNIGIHREDVNPDTWLMLREADVADSVVVNGKQYYFFHEAKDENDAGVLKLLSASGHFDNVSDVVSDSALDAFGQFFWRTQKAYQREKDIGPNACYPNLRTYTLAPYDSEFDTRKAMGWVDIIGGSAIIGLTVWGNTLTGGWLIPPSIVILYSAVGMIFQGIEYVWNIDMPDLPYFPNP